MNLLKGTGCVLRLLKSIFFACVVAIALILLISAFCAIFGAGQNLLTALSVVVKVVAVGVCTFIFSNGSSGIVKGLVCGALTWLMLFLLFFALSGGIVSGKIWLNLIFCLIFGIIFGIIFANLKNTANNSWKRIKNLSW